MCLLCLQGVHELDVVVDGVVRAPSALDAAPLLKQFYLVDGPALARRLSAACPSLQLAGLDTIKLQWNEG